MNAFRCGLILGTLSAAAISFPAYAQSGATLRANLVEPEKNAERKALAVRVHVGGAALMDPTRGNESWAAHLHYVLDDGAAIATASPRMSFHGLPSGQHTLLVRLMNHRDEPLAEEKKLEVSIP